MKTIIYSVNLNNYDEFKTPNIIDPNVRYILFTDNKYFKSKVWEIYHTDFITEDLDIRKKARFIKTNSHSILPQHDVSIWIDHCYLPKFNNTQKLFEEINFKDKEIMCYKHNERNCIYQESEIVKKDRLDFPDVVNNQMNKYRIDGFPPNYGLYDSGFTIRRNNRRIKTFNELWWNEIKNHSGRDQLSQVYSSWKTDVKIHPISNGGNIYSNKYLTSKTKHPKKWLI